MSAAGAEAEGSPPTLDYVEQVAASRAFSGSTSLPRLLRYLAERAVAEPGETIKEFRIATEALGRGAGFDSRTDSVVRVTTARLRSKLEEYYAAEGLGDPVRLHVPKGSYRLLALPAGEPAGDEAREPAPLRVSAGRLCSWRPSWRFRGRVSYRRTVGRATPPLIPIYPASGAPSPTTRVESAWSIAMRLTRPLPTGES